MRSINAAFGQFLAFLWSRWLFDPLVSLCAFFTFSMEKSSLFPKSAVDFEFILFAIWVIALFYAFATFSI